MSYKTLRSFVDPSTGTPYKKGAEYACADEKHIEKLIKYGLIEGGAVVQRVSAQEPVLAPKRTRKRGASDGDS